jgi:hypothetical protein
MVGWVVIRKRKDNTMKTRTKNTTFVLTLAILVSAFFFASATIIKISTSKEAVAIATTTPMTAYENAISVEFNFEEEEYINDIPLSTYEVRDFYFEEEEYIDDIPESINNAVL